MIKNSVMNLFSSAEQCCEFCCESVVGIINAVAKCLVPAFHRRLLYT
jgi:hypothetical protein